MSDDIPTQDASVPIPVRSSDPDLDGRYVRKQKLGGGGQAIVYSGCDTRTDEPVAIKVYRREELEPQDDIDKRAKIVEREKRIMCRLNYHPNLIAFKDHVTDKEGNHYLIQELFEGRQLDEYVEDRLRALGASRGKEMVTPFAVIRSIVMQLVSALAEVHSKKLVHRDVKPDNILCKQLPDGSMQVKLIDLGIGKSTKETVALPQLTMDGMIVGTPNTMAPEQVEPGRGPLSPKTDLFSVGVVIYYLMTGEYPIDFRVSEKATTSGGNNAMYFKLGHDLQLALGRDRYPHALVKKAHAELQELALDLMEREPDKRPASAEAVYKRLEEMKEVAAAPRSVPPASAPRLSVRPTSSTSGSMTTGYRVPMNGSPKGRIAIGILVLLAAICAGTYFILKAIDSPPVKNPAPASTTTERSQFAAASATPSGSATVTVATAPTPTPTPVPVTTVMPPFVESSMIKSLTSEQRGIIEAAKAEVRGPGKCVGITRSLIKLSEDRKDFPDTFYYLAECAKKSGTASSEAYYRGEYLRRIRP